MSKEVLWNKIILEEFIRIAILTDEEESILRHHVRGASRVENALLHNMCLSTYDEVIKRLKRKYDDAQKYSNILPERIKKSVKD